MWRLYFLVERCYKLREPVLLVGDTGGGKTTVCQLLSIVMGSRLHSLNCHMYTETSDFLGVGLFYCCKSFISLFLFLWFYLFNASCPHVFQGFYPVRDRSRLAMEFKYHIEKLKQSKIFLLYWKATVCLPFITFYWFDILFCVITIDPVTFDFWHAFLYLQTISSDIEQASSTLNQLNEVLNDYRQGAVSHPDLKQEDLDAFEQVKLDLLQLQHRWQTLFLWQDGPLVQAMKEGDLLLVDEISLADDSVLERLNSVLEPERKLVGWSSC